MSAERIASDLKDIRSVVSEIGSSLLEIREHVAALAENAALRAEVAHLKGELHKAKSELGAVNGRLKLTDRALTAIVTASPRDAKPELLTVPSIVVIARSIFAEKNGHGDRAQDEIAWQEALRLRTDEDGGQYLKAAPRLREARAVLCALGFDGYAAYETFMREIENREEKAV